ncbi:MAG: MBL fold metallo-hydrolase [Planctomycetota bacterium]
MWRRRALRAALAALVLVVGLPLGLGLLFAAPRYRGPVSDHFDGERFTNRVPLPGHGAIDIARWQLGRERGGWADYAPQVVPTVPEERVAGDALRVTFVGHATVLVQTAGLNVLLDPIWSDRASPVGFAGPLRHAPPGVDFDDLPPIDLVLVSHNHYDHLDVATLRRLAERDGPTILLPLGNAALLEEESIAGGRDLDWWDSFDVAEGVRATCVPAQHFSGRGIGDRMATLWCGFVLATPGGTIYFAGDTGAGPHFAEVRERFGPPRLALLPIGAYLPRWFMSPVHVDPAESVEAFGEVGAAFGLAVHFGCFELADDGPLQPVRELEQALDARGVARERFRALAIGEAWDVPTNATSGAGSVLEQHDVR